MIKNKRGQSLVEFALVLPILMALLLAIVEFALAFNAQISLVHAAREAVRYAVVGVKTDTQIKDRAIYVTGGEKSDGTEVDGTLYVVPDNITITRDTSNKTVTILLEYPYHLQLFDPVVAAFTDQPMILHASAVMGTE